jgi:hypothetical protein
LSPAAIAVHDDGHMSWDAIGIEVHRRGHEADQDVAEAASTVSDVHHLFFLGPADLIYLSDVVIGFRLGIILELEQVVF